MALGLAAPALAYTSNIPSTSSPCVLDIYLAEYSTGIFGTSLSSPASNRGYARNEVVAAIATVTVSANANIRDTYGQIVLGGENVSLNVTDNQINAAAATASITDSLPAGQANWVKLFDWSSANNEFTKAFTATNTFPVSAKSQNYSFLFFGKVIDDNANMYIELNRNGRFANMNQWATVTPQYLRPAGVNPTGAGNFANFTIPVLQFMMVNSDYIVYTTGAVGTARTYYISDNPAAGVTPTLLLAIEVLASNKTDGVLLSDGTNAYRFYMTPSGDITIHDVNNNAPVVTSSAKYNGLLASFNTIFDSLGLSLANRTNSMTNADWETISNASNIRDTVSIEPWTPYVQIPEAPVITPPKTGDAATVIGFVFIAISAGLALVVKKARA